MVVTVSATRATSSACRSAPTARRAAAGAGSRAPNRSEGDFVEHLFVANTHDYLLFFTNQGRVYERRVYDVPEMSRTSQGRAIANLLEFQPGEKVANVLAVKDFDKEEQFLMFATAKGAVKKTALSRLREHPPERHHRDRPGRRRRADRRRDHQRQGSHHARHQERPGDPIRRSRRPRHGPPGGRRHGRRASSARATRSSP